MTRKLINFILIIVILINVVFCQDAASAATCDTLNCTKCCKDNACIDDILKCPLRPNSDF